jgi:hypothetical protein
MPRGRALSNDARWIVVQMCSSMDIDAIAYHTGVKRRTIERILSDFKKHSTANRHKASAALQGAPRVLSNDNVGARIYFFECF